MTLILTFFRKHHWLTFVILLSIAFTLSCTITFSFSTEPDLSDSISAAIIGDSRMAISQQFFETADLYFHKGSEHIIETKFSNDIFQKVKRIVSPSAHAHIAHNNIEEIMPWLWLSIKMNPQNIETYLVTSFWLANSAKKPEVALEVLNEAQLNNPYNYQIQIEKGRIYLKQGDLDAAQNAFDAALVFWTKTADQLNEYQNMDRAEALLYRGLLAEYKNDTILAVRLYKEILTHFPNRTSIKERIDILENGGKPEVIANSYWANILKTHINNKSKCQYEGEHEHDENCQHQKEHEHDESCTHHDKQLPQQLKKQP